MVGQILGTLLILRAGGEYIVAVTLVLFAVLGWLSMRKALPAPSPNPDLKIDYNIVFDTLRNLAFAFKDLPVLRPMLGTAWYYGLSAAVLIIMPAYIEGVLHYNAQVFILTMISFVIGAALGALAITILAKGRDAVGLAAIAAFGIILFSLDLYFSAGINAFTKFDPLVLGAGGKPELGTVADFFSNSATPRFLIGLVGAAMSASMFVVPMNTMAQRRANPMQRARLLAAGSIMLNAATTGVQGLVFLMTLTVLPMQTPFLIIALCTIPIALYSSYRAWILRKTPAPTGAE